MIRPNFEDIKSYGEFSEYYWYREELQAICKKIGASHDGNKLYLLAKIRAYFDGEIIPPVKLINNKTKIVKNLTKDTPLIYAGFSFGNKFRQFYADLTNDKNFKFTADMVATAKQVRENNDENFTLNDLLKIKSGEITYVKYDKSALQWNKFVKDFCADEYTKKYPDKLKTAAAFWKILRESNQPKIYSREFIIQNENRVLMK